MVTTSPVRSIVQCLAKRDGTDRFYAIKMLQFDGQSQIDRQGRMLLHTEYSLLSLLSDQPGVAHHHGLFMDTYEEPVANEEGVVIGKREKKRLCLVLDCITPHDFSVSTQHLINLQHYVIREKKLPEIEALVIFRDIVRTVRDIHTVSVCTEQINNYDTELLEDIREFRNYCCMDGWV
jgi:serine/threonine-protein kinase 40